MPSTIKFSQASKHSNTIAATYKLIQRSFFGLMSALLVTTLSVALVGQISVNAISDNISQDPIVLAQQYLDNSQNSISFTKSKSLESVIQYLKTKNLDATNVVVYSTIQIDNQYLDIPFNVDLFQDLPTNQKSFEDSKNRLIANIKSSKTDKPNPQAPTEIDLGDVSLNVKEAQAINDTKLDEVKSKAIEIAINKVSFTAKSNNPTIQAFEKSGKKIEIQKKSALSKTAKLNDSKNSIAISDSDIESVTTSKPSQEERNKILDEAQKTKEGIARKENERFIGETIVKPAKEKIKQDHLKNQKLKAKEVQKLIREGKKSQIKVEDVYQLGDESIALGLDVFIPSKQEDISQRKVIIDEVKALNYEEEKQISFLHTVLSLGTIQANAFSPNYNNTNMYHAMPKMHYGTVLDLYGGNQNNGADVGLWYRNNNSNWNQKFDLLSDDTIRVGGKCLDMSDYGKINRGENANNVKIHLWDCNGGLAQKWIYDTEGLLRLKGNTNYCMDTSYGGGANNTLSLWQCGGTTYTESFRASEYAIRFYARRGEITQANVGHAFVSLARYDNYNNIAGLSSYSLWPDPKDNDSTNNNTWFDSSNNHTTYEENDRSNRGYWDNVNVNNTSDLNDGYDGTQKNDFHANANRTSYWQKIITRDQANIMLNGGYDVGSGQSTYIYTGYFCSNYSKLLWGKFGGIGFLSWTPSPQEYYNILLGSQMYN